MKELTLNLCKYSGNDQSKILIHRLVIAGWTGRDRDAVEAHIIELEELGVPRPETVPTYYPAASAILTTDKSIEVVGGNSSGEVEFVILKAFDQLWIGVGSDHTDRQLETHDVTLSKQVCAKPIADTFWLLSEVVDHWDSLVLRSYIEEGGESIMYQEGSVSAMLDPRELIARYEELKGKKFEEGMIMFGGTLPAIGGIRPSSMFDFQLHDPVLERGITYSYKVTDL